MHREDLLDLFRVVVTYYFKPDECLIKRNNGAYDDNDPKIILTIPIAVITILVNGFVIINFNSKGDIKTICEIYRKMWDITNDLEIAKSYFICEKTGRFMLEG